MIHRSDPTDEDRSDRRGLYSEDRLKTGQSPNADLEDAAEVLWVGGDESANVNNQLLLQYSLNWIKRKTSVIQDTLYVIRSDRLVNHLLILTPDTDC